MGADPYWYYVPYQEDKNNALQSLRKREFEAGRYFPVMDTSELEFPLNNLLETPAPGKGHETVADLMADLFDWECDTYSILDIVKISDRVDCSAAYVLEEEDLIKYFGTSKPTREIIDEKIWDYWLYIANSFGVRGIGLCITVYKEDLPTELYFGGYTYD